MVKVEYDLKLSVYSIIRVGPFNLTLVKKKKHFALGPPVYAAVFSRYFSLLVIVPDHGQIGKAKYSHSSWLSGQWAGLCQYVSRLDDFW